MQKGKLFGFKLLLWGVFFSVFSGNVSAAEIQNLKIVPTSTELSIQWDNLSEDISSQTHGYAVQWGESTTAVKTDADPKQTLSPSRNYISIRAADFEREKTYFFRVQSYIKEDNTRGYKLFNGSKILQWKWLLNGEIESEYLEPNDPVSESPLDSTGESRFEQIRIVPFDKSAQFSWSRPNLADSEYTGFKIIVSKNEDLSEPVHEFSPGKAVFKSYLEGLEPSTQYYVGGRFFKRNLGFEEKFGKSTVIPFRTEDLYDSIQQSRFYRTLQRLKNYGLGTTAKVGGTKTSDLSTSSVVKRTPSNTTDINQRISEIRSQIADLQAELRSLELRLRSGSSSSSRTSSSTNSQASTKSRLSLRERILLKLGRK